MTFRRRFSVLRPRRDLEKAKFSSLPGVVCLQYPLRFRSQGAGASSEGTYPFNVTKTLLRKYPLASKYDGGCQEEYLCHDGQGWSYIGWFGRYAKFRAILALDEDG